MARTPTNFRLRRESLELLNSVANLTGDDKTVVTEICLSLYALEVGHEVKKAKELLYDSLFNLATTQNKHRTARRRAVERALRDSKNPAFK